MALWNPLEVGTDGSHVGDLPDAKDVADGVEAQEGHRERRRAGRRGSEEEEEEGGGGEGQEGSGALLCRDEV